MFSAGLGRLAGAVGEVLADGAGGAGRLRTAELADIMSTAMEDPDLLPDTLLAAPPATGLGKYLLSAGPHHVLVAMATVPGLPVPPHDHGDWGVVGLYRGQEEEITFDLDPEAGQLTESRRRRYRAGEVMVIPPPPDDVHQVVNRGNEPAVSVHLHPHDFVGLGFRMFVGPEHRPVATGPLEYDQIPGAPA